MLRRAKRERKIRSTASLKQVPAGVGEVSEVSTATPKTNKLIFRPTSFVQL